VSSYLSVYNVCLSPRFVCLHCLSLDQGICQHGLLFMSTRSVSSSRHLSICIGACMHVRLSFELPICLHVHVLAETDRPREFVGNGYLSIFTTRRSIYNMSLLDRPGEFVSNGYLLNHALCCSTCGEKRNDKVSKRDLVYREKRPTIVWRCAVHLHLSH
jgi:hypothetical protein